MEDDKKGTLLGDDAWVEDERTKKIFARHLERGESLIFLLPDKLVTDPEKGSVGLAYFRQYENCGFGCTKVVSRERGVKRQILAYNECAPEREQDLVYFGVSAARRFGQKEVFFVASEGIGYMISCSDDERLGEERLSDGVKTVPSPKKITADDVMAHITAVIGERFAAASDSVARYKSEDDCRQDFRREMIRKYGYDCVDTFSAGAFEFWRDFPEETVRDRMASRLLRHTTMAVLIPKNVIRDEGRTLDRFEDLTLNAAFGYDDVYSGDSEEKKAMILFQSASRHDDKTFLYYTVSAGRVFDQPYILYVNPWGYCKKVLCKEEDGKKIGDMAPVCTDANGAERKISADEFTALLSEIAGGDVRLSESKVRHFNGVSGMVVGSILSSIDRLGYDCLLYAKKPIVVPEEGQ